MKGSPFSHGSESMPMPLTETPSVHLSKSLFPVESKSVPGIMRGG